MLDDWPNPLSQRTALVRLDGVEVYYDFDWTDVFGHNQSAFPNGQALACLVRRECPESLIPTLLLTCLEGEERRTHVTEDRFVAIVPIRDYLALAKADPAATYFVRHSRTPVTDLTRLSRLSDGDVRTLLDVHLNADSLEIWCDASPRHRENLLDLLRRRPDLNNSVDHVPSAIADQIRALVELDPQAVAAFLDYLDRIGWPHAVRSSLLSAIASTPGVAAAVGQALGDGLAARLQEVRNDASAYRQLIESSQVGETAVQEFIEERPWLVGLEYHGVRGRLPVLRGETDFILDRFDGFYDILELKSPADLIVEETRSGRDDQPGAPSKHRLGRPLSLALAQAHLYRYALSTLSPESAEMYGLPYHRHPAISILIGRVADLSVTGRHILTELNLSLSRIQVIPFDRLAERIEGIVANLENLLGASERDVSDAVR